MRLYRPDGSNLDLCRRQEVERGKRVVLPGTERAELVDELKPSHDARLDAERLMEGGPQQIGAFYRSPLEGHLRDPVSTPSWSAGATSNCMRATISGLLSYPTQGRRL